MTWLGLNKKNEERERGGFPGGPVVRLCFHARGLGLMPGWGIKIPYAAQHSRKTQKWRREEG